MTPISEYAIIVGPNDNVAVVKKETFVDLEVLLLNGSSVKLRKAVPPGIAPVIELATASFNSGLSKRCRCESC